jgi:hypothetical protein
MRETVDRLEAGWMNHYRKEELRSLFRDRGFVLLREDAFDGNRLFVLIRSASVKQAALLWPEAGKCPS